MQVFLNGQLLNQEDAKVSVFDRGFLFGDGVYEVIPVYANKMFRFHEHIERLENSLNAIHINNPYNQSEWQNICQDLIKVSQSGDNKALYIQVTRGVSERQHLYEETMVPTVFVMCNKMYARSYDKGVGAIIHEDIRWHKCDIKAITLLPNILLRQLAKDTGGAYEAILIRDNQVTEGAASNVFIVKGTSVYTPPKDGNILPGITRDLLVELLRDSGQIVYEEAISLEGLMEADEIWLTGSTTGIAPVLQIDGVSVGNGKPGSLWNSANNIFNAYIEKIKTSPVE